MARELIGVNIGSYTFDASAGTVTINDVPTFNLEQVYLITNTTDQVVIYQFNSASLGGSLASNVLTLTYDTSSMSDTDSLAIQIEFENSVIPLEIVIPPPEPPPGTTSVVFNTESEGRDVSGNQNSYSYRTITNGTTFKIQQFSGDGEGESRSKIELYHDPNGDNPTGGQGGNNIPAAWVLIDVIYISDGGGRQQTQDLNTSYTGDGTARIAIRRKRLEGGTRELFGKVIGYEE